jgi:hypothetical protein
MIKKALIVTMMVFLLAGIELQAIAASPSVSSVTSTQPHGVKAIISKLPSIAHQPLLNHTLNTVRPSSNGATNTVGLQLAKTTAAKSITAIVNALNMVNSRIDASKLSGDDRTTLMAQINSNITWFESQSNAIQTSNDPAAIRMDISQVTSQWNGIKTGIKQETGLMACDEFDSRLSNASHASSIVSEKIQALNAQGKDASALQSALSDYNSHVASATTYSQNARADFSSITSPTNADASYSAGLKQLTLGQQQLTASYQDLITIYRLVLGNNVTINTPVA